MDENFFFSGNDAAFQESNKIDRQFPSKLEIILNVSGSIGSGHYLTRIGQLTHGLQAWLCGGWKSSATIRREIVTNEHAPAQERAQTVQNIEAWYPAYEG